MDRYAHIASYVYSTPWAILPAKLATILGLLELRASGGHVDEAEIAAVVGAAQRPSLRPTGAVAVIPIYGTIAHHAGMMVESSGGVSTESIAAKFRAAMADSTIGAVVLAFDTPGGSVAGVTELANEIYRARGTKPIVSVADSLAASAGYWLAAAADEVVVSPSAEIGSVGVILAHSEVSEAMAKEGVRVTVISAGEHKAEHSPYAPLTEDAKAELQRRVDAAYSVFVGDLAKFRGVGVETVRNNFGGGRVYGGKEAVSRGMADRVATIDETIARLAGPRRIVNAARAERARMLLY